VVNPVVGTSPSAVYPSSRSWLGIAREGAGTLVGTPVPPTNTIPMDPKSYSPEDTPKFLPDEALRGQMAMLYNEILGPEDASFSFGGPNFLDTYGFMLDNIFGDLSTTGTASGTVVTSFTGNPAVGATVITVASGTAFGTGSTIQIDTGSVSEVVVVTASSSTTISFGNNPLRFAHSTGTVITVTGPYTHTFALLNSGAGYGGILGAQPPTHTLTDNTNIITTGTYANPYGARYYPSACLSTFDLSGNAEQLLDIKVSGNSWPSVIPGTTPTKNISTAIPIPAWTSKVYIGGTAANNQVFDVGEWAINIKRQLQVYWTDQGAQTPYIIARGPLSISGTMNFTVPSDDSPLNYMIQNTQPQIRILMSNTTQGLSGTATLTLQFDAQVAAFVKSKPDRNAVLIGYQNSWDAVANSTNVGGSGGLAPGSVTLINNVPTY
jgi:hypothetical protein